jgi:hypothetical protein
MPNERRRALFLALLAGLLAALPAAARAETVWLCKPGMEANPCAGSLETTVYTSSGESSVESPVPVKRPRIDCFYVYPTVSEEPGRNSDLEPDAQEIAIAQYQAARYSQRCRVFAPMYRQATLASLAQGGEGQAEALRTAYGDVRDAWRDYLKNESRGRGFVLIGHSQGTRMLRQLVRKEIDPKRKVRRRLVSALLLGANVRVAKGRKVGGDFRKIPACTAPRQVRCVVAWSTFNETPPDNSRYGRSEDASPDAFGLPAGPEYEVLCTNPASLRANRERPLTTYMRSEPFPGVLGALLVLMYGGPQPTADTPWLEPQDHYTGRCVRENEANVLMLEPIDGARKLNPSPTPDWGLHLADANIALGDLIALVTRQERAYLAKTRR